MSSIFKRIASAAKSVAVNMPKLGAGVLSAVQGGKLPDVKILLDAPLALAGKQTYTEQKQAAAQLALSDAATSIVPPSVSAAVDNVVSTVSANKEKSFLVAGGIVLFLVLIFSGGKRRRY